jgi:hypothetical protein
MQKNNSISSKNNKRYKKINYKRTGQTFQEVYNILKMDVELDTTKRHFEKPQRPDREVSINLNLPTKLDKYTKTTLSQILAFIDLKKRRRFVDGNTVMPISCTNDYLKLLTGSTRQTSRLIQKMKRLGLIVTSNNTYRFNAKYKRFNRCKIYIYSAESEKAIVEFCKNNNIKKASIKQQKAPIVINKIIENINFKENEIRINSKLNLVKPTNVSRAEFEKFLMFHLYNNYKQLGDYQKKVDSINETYYKDDPDRRIKFNLRTTWSTNKRFNTERVTKIGIRATNSLVSTKKNWEPGDENKNVVHRSEVLKQYGLENGYEYDVKSSVPRVAYLINFGEWLDDDIDLYYLIFLNLVKQNPEKYSHIEWNEENRKVFKSFFMRGFFDTEAKIAGHIARELSTRIKYDPKDWGDLETTFKDYKKAITATIGPSLDSEIFLHESCIYIDVQQQLLLRGYNNVQVYDGFYTGEDVEDICNIVKTCAINYYNKYIAKEVSTKKIGGELFPSISKFIHTYNPSIFSTSSSYSSSSSSSNSNSFITIYPSIYSSSSSSSSSIYSISSYIRIHKSSSSSSSSSYYYYYYYTHTHSSSFYSSSSISHSNIHTHTNILTVPVTVHNKLYTTIVDNINITGPPVRKRGPP